VTVRRTKIVSTIGPASRDRLEELLRAGTDVCRLNFSHGTHAEYAPTIADIRRLAETLSRPVAILADLQGPKIRTGKLRGGKPITLRVGQTVALTAEAVEGDAARLAISLPEALESLFPGARVLLNDGAIELKVAERKGGDLLCEVVLGGELGERKGVNLPDTPVDCPALTEKDLRDLDFALAQGADYLALSFVRTADDVRQLKEAIRDRGGDVPVIAKIERPQAVENIEAILQAADGVMVARGDLGVEMSGPKVPVAQKRIIAQANRAGKPVITATQMLESMVHAAKPTRAEASDVANAILDGSDAVMLSQETAIGQYPVRAVETMALIAEEADAHLELTASDERVQDELRLRVASSVAEAVAGAAFYAARRLEAAALIVFTHSGDTARLVAQPRPQRPIFAMTPEETTYRRLALVWGVRAFRIPTTDDATELLRLGEEKLLGEKVLEPHDTVVMLSGRTHSPGTTNTLRVHVLGER